MAAQDLRAQTASLISRRELGLAVAAVAVAGTGDAVGQDTSDGPMRHYITIDMKPDIDVLALDRWYIAHHAPETLRRTGGAQTRYVTYRTYAISDVEVQRFNVARGRLTEIEFPSVASLRAGFTPEARARVTLTPPDPSIAPGWTVDTVSMRAAPTRTFKDALTPDKGTPYFRWILFARYPDGVSEQDGDAWLSGTFGPAIAALSEARRTLLFHRLDHGVFAQKYTRVFEIWFDSIIAWRQAVTRLDQSLSRPAWGGEFPYLAIRSGFIGERPDLDFKTDKRVTP